MNTKQVDQMELSLEAKTRRRSRPPARLQNRQRAQFWFSRMRQVVGSAMEWTPEGEERPSQICLSLTAKRS